MTLDAVFDQIADIARQEHAGSIVLFGSRARGEALPKSDIDLAVSGCPNFPRLEDRLQEELWSLLSLDIVNLDAPCSEDLRNEIAKDGVVLYEEVR